MPPPKQTDSLIFHHLDQPSSIQTSDLKIIIIVLRSPYSDLHDFVQYIVSDINISGEKEIFDLI